MSVVKTYFSAWRLVLKQVKLWGLLYFLNFVFALLVSYPAFQFLNEKLAHSVALDNMYARFDFTVFNDILNQYGDVVDFISSQGMVTGFLFLLLSIFLSGGILQIFRIEHEQKRFNDFWKGGAKYYWRIFGLTILFLTLQGLIAFLFFSAFNFLTDGGLDRFHSEASIYRRAVVVFTFWSLFASFIWMIQDYAKVAMVSRDCNLFSAIAKGLKFVFKNLGTTLFLYFLNLMTFGLVFWLYWRTPSFQSVGLALIVGQLFLIFRIGTKLLNLATATLWHSERSNEPLV